MRVSLIIPCAADRLHTLPWVLDGHAAQSLPPEHSLEILVGIDGSQQGPVSSSPGVSLHPFPRMGAAAVRNRLAALATGDVLLFGNADTRPEPGMVAAHIAAHARIGPGHLVLGDAPWETPSHPTVMDALLAHTPAVFFYAGLVPGQFYDWRHAWTLNLSLSRADFLSVGGFNEQLRPVYYEDIELAHRLLGDRPGVFYEPAARVVHRHPTTLDQYLDREELLGLMSPVLAQHAPDTFAKLVSHRSLETLEENYRIWTTMDHPMHRFIYQRTREWTDRPATAVGGLSLSTLPLLSTIYQMHIPLKRLAFRLGFLAGIPLAHDSHWQSRKPTSLWRTALNLTPPV